jgi:hypothetical protein
MKEFIFSLASASPYFQSRNYEMEEKRDRKEDANDFEKRTWRLRTHVNSDGQVIIPAEAFQFSIRDASAYLGERIPGKGQRTWTKHFASGILVPDDIVLPERRETIAGIWLSLNPQGKRGGGSRVQKCMPVIQQWAGDLRVIVLDDLITEEVLRRTVEHAGAFIGIGQNRPQNGGRHGRFQVVEMVAVGPMKMAAE